MSDPNRRRQKNSETKAAGATAIASSKASVDRAAAFRRVRACRGFTFGVVSKDLLGIANDIINAQASPAPQEPAASEEGQQAAA
jgi:hypothetical protein